MGNFNFKSKSRDHVAVSWYPTNRDAEIINKLTEAASQNGLRQYDSGYAATPTNFTSFVVYSPTTNHEGLYSFRAMADLVLYDMRACGYATFVGQAKNDSRCP